MSVTYRVSLCVCVFMMAFLCGIPGYSANTEAFMEISPMAREYTLEQKVSLTVQPGSGEFKQSYEWLVMTPGSDQYKPAYMSLHERYNGLPIKTFSRSTWYTLAKLGEYSFRCNYFYRIRTNQGSYLDKYRTFNMTILVKANNQTSSLSAAESKRLDGKLFCYNHSATSTLPIDTIEVDGRVKCIIVELKEIVKNGVGSEVITAADINRVKSWDWYSKDAVFEEVRTLEKTSLNPNEKIWQAPAKVGTYDLSCCVNYDGTLISTFTKQIKVVAKTVPLSTDSGLTILAPSPVKGLVTRTSEVNGILINATTEFKTPVVASSSLSANFEWKASLGSIYGLGRSANWKYDALSGSSGSQKVTISCVAKTSKGQILEKADKVIELVYPLLKPAYQLTISGISPIKGVDTYTHGFQKQVSFRASLSASANPKPQRGSRVDYQWLSSIGTVKAYSYGISGTNLAWDFIAPPSAIPSKVDITCIQTVNMCFTNSVTRSFVLHYDDQNYPSWSCARDCPTTRKDGRCGDGCSGGCSSSFLLPNCKNHCSDKIPIGKPCPQCGRKSPW